MKNILIITLVLVLTSCGTKYKSVSDYHIQPNALKDGERIKLLFTIYGNTDNREDKYYNQVVAVSVESGDTCNILVPVNHGFTEEDGNKVFNYFSPEGQSAELAMLDFDNLKDINDINSVKHEFPKYQKVIYDPQFDKWQKNNFPTVMGFIGTQN